MAAKLKTAAMARAGHEYQDLVALEKLIDFFRNKSKYRWITLESEDPVMGFLDDIVAALADGTFEIMQVKFTGDPEAYKLDWEWLLKKKPKGTSLLKKWSATLSDFTGGPIKLACLYTNRPPGAEFAACLGTDGKVQFEKIPASIRSRVESDIGGIYKARKFFEAFEFLHSKPMLEDLEDDLKCEVVPAETDTIGWLNLKMQAKRWAMRKLEPAPDGRITYSHLTQIITKGAPRNMPQSFAIPKGYAVPSASFHTPFLNRVTSSACTSILWGTPGRGKSTYLSYLTNELRKADVPIVRHHYFLSSDDPTTDRFSFPNIAQSLMDQILVHYPDAVKGLEEDTNQLSKWLKACGEYFEKKGKPFLIVVDGLDHVWREQRNLTQLDHLFDHLLPTPHNVGLIVGTQKIDESKLPEKLLQRASDSDWHEIPPMDELAVQKWVKQQYKGKRLRLAKRRYDETLDVQLGEVGRAFFEISAGHPLHLIYSFEALVRKGNYVDAEAVRLLPSCPDGNINVYYGKLWRKLSPRAREIVHLIAGSDFHWPLSAIVQHFGQIDEIDFLLERRRTGLVPFHGSILAFVRSKPDHSAILRSLLPRAIKWLRKSAPEYWRWGWLWLTEAKNGNFAPLLQNTSRDWAITSIKSGWPIEQLVRILEEAEKKAFSDFDYSRTIQIRSLKTRIQNGDEYQTDNFSKLNEVAIVSSGNTQIINAMIDGLSTLDEESILVASRASHRLMPEVCDECMEELAHRINIWINLRHRPTDIFITISKYFVEVAALAPSLDVARVIRFISGFKDGSEVLTAFIKTLEATKRIGALQEALSLLTMQMREAWRIEVFDALIHASVLEKVDVAADAESQKGLKISSFAALWCWYQKISHTGEVVVPTRPDNLSDKSPGYEQRAILKPYLYEVFFYSVIATLRSLEPIELPSLQSFSDKAIKMVGGTACDLAAGRAQLSFSSIYYGAREIEPVNEGNYSDPAYYHYFDFKAALRSIAIDLHLIKQPRGVYQPLSDEELSIAVVSKHWVHELWLEDQLERWLPILSAGTAAEMLKAEEQSVSESISQFNERTDKWVQLSRLALLYGVRDSSALLARAINCMIGHGWRKDLWIDEILESIAELHRYSATPCLPLIRKLAPIVDKITKFTDGDETNHIRSELIDVVGYVSPNKLSYFYRHHLEAEEYSYAQAALDKYLEVTNLSDDAAKALARTAMEYRDVAVLTKRAISSAAAAELLETQRKYLGGMPPKPREYASSPDNYSLKGTPPDPSDFKPDEFDKLLRAISEIGHVHQANMLLGWLDYWANKGRAKAVLETLKHYFETEERTYPARDILDKAFEISLKYEGRKKAYYWIVLAHINYHGWARHYSSSEAVVNRLQLAAQHYKTEWRAFIADTSAPEKYWQLHDHSFSIGIKYLVKFLLMVGQTEEAIAYTRACVKIAEQEVSDQPLPAAGWFQ